VPQKPRNRNGRTVAVEARKKQLVAFAPSRPEKAIQELTRGETLEFDFDPLVRIEYA
jgi:hypothetical protein